MALCLAQAGPCQGAVSFGGELHRSLFAQLGVPAVLVDPPLHRSSPVLLQEPEVAAFVAKIGAPLLCFKPNRRLEEQAATMGVQLAAASPSVSQGLENKLRLAGIAAKAQVPTAPQAQLDSPDEATYEALAEAWGEGFVVQSPRGFAGAKTWRVQRATDWNRLQKKVGRRSLRIARFVPGPPCTLNAVVDRRGNSLVSAPIAQLTGLAWATRHPLGSCGNDFLMRQEKTTAKACTTMASSIAAVLAEEGYVGHFGLDFVLGPDGPALIEINPRLTASFALYAVFRPEFLSAHLEAVAGGQIPSQVLPAEEAGQCILHNLSEKPATPLASDQLRPVLPKDLDPGQASLWPAPGPVGPDGTRGRLVLRGPCIDDSGNWLHPWRPPEESASVTGDMDLRVEI